jgi:hypothetical protein
LRGISAGAWRLDSGLSQHRTDEVDDSKLIAEMLRHKAGNIEAAINAHDRMSRGMSR